MRVRVIINVGLLALSVLMGIGIDELCRSSMYQHLSIVNGVSMQMNGHRHGTEDLVISCMDYRFRRLVGAWIDSNLGGQADVISWPGGSSVVIAETTQTWSFDAIEAARRLHNITRVHMINHRDCGGHGGSDRHQNLEAERRYHHEQLWAAARLIAERFPDLEVQLYFADFGEITEIPRQGEVLAGVH